MRPDNNQQNYDKHMREQQDPNAQAQSEQAAQDQARQDQDTPDTTEPAAPNRRAFAPSMPAASAALSAVSATPNVCARLTPDLKAYQDGQMGWRQKWSATRHLTRCAACREELEAMREFSDRWRGADAEVLDPALRARILAAVPDTRPAAPAGSAPSRLRPRPLLLAGAGLSAAIGAIVLFPVVVKNSGSVPDASKAADIASSSAPPAAAGLAQSRREGYAAAPVILNGNAASGFAAPAAKANSAAANPAGTQVADARQSFADKSGAPGEQEQAARDRDVEGNRFGMSGDKGAQAAATGGAVPTTSSATAAASSASPSATAAASSASPSAIAAASSASPSASSVSGGSAPPMPAMGKVSAPPFPPTPAPLSASSPAPSTESASDPFKARDRQATANPVQLKPDANRSPNSPKKVVHPARIAEALPTDKTAQSGSVTGEAAGAGDAAKASVPHHAARVYARPPAARRAASTQANNMQTDADTPGVTLKIRVEHAEAAAADIEKHTRAMGGAVVVSETTTDADGAKSATLKLKAPSSDLDALIAHIGRTGTVLSQTMSSTRSVVGNNATPANENVAQTRNGNRAQNAATTNITVLLQSR